MSSLLSEKQKAKLSKNVKQFFVKFLIFVLLVGLSYVILYPFIFKILAAFMSKEDLYNTLVDIVPMDWSLDNFKFVINTAGYFDALKNTLLYAFIVAILATKFMNLFYERSTFT